MKPDKIILWLGEDKFPDHKLPEIFDKIRACGVDIEFRKDIGAHTKYFYAMKEYPEDLIVTFDDDWVYDRDVIERLYQSYAEHPECVSALRIDRVRFNPDGSLKSYKDFDWRYKSEIGYASFSYIATGVGSVLYPPHCEHEEIFNTEAIKKLCFHNDDIWLKVFQLIKGVKVVRAPGTGYTPAYIIEEAQVTGLTHLNHFEGNRTNEQMKAVLDTYNTWPLALTGKTLLELMREDSDGVE